MLSYFTTTQHLLRPCSSCGSCYVSCVSYYASRVCYCVL